MENEPIVSTTPTLDYLKPIFDKDPALLTVGDGMEMRSALLFALASNAPDLISTAQRVGGVVGMDAVMAIFSEYFVRAVEPQLGQSA